VAPSTKPAVAPPATPENARPARQRLDEALALESALVTQARADLKRGDPRAALATLQRLKRESPRGVLHQEREVLTVQALAAAGHKDAARARARAFIKSFPNSPHAPLLRSLASDP
jgi:outer membrane protein assembly factor BamD (BamD/ComL family)